MGKYFVGGVLAIALVSCGGKSGKKATTDGTKGSKTTAPQVDPTLCDTKGKRVETSDLNRDNKPDVWRLYESITEAGVTREILTCRQVDFDHDGKKDQVVAFNRKGGKVWDKLDLTFDGKFDVWALYDEKTGVVFQIQRDSDFDGAFDSTERYTAKGQLEWVRRDRNGDQQPDVWEQYVEGELVAILYDDDYDQKVDRREKVKLPKKETPKPPADKDGADKDGADKDGGDKDGADKDGADKDGADKDGGNP